MSSMLMELELESLWNSLSSYFIYQHIVFQLLLLLRYFTMSLFSMQASFLSLNLHALAENLAKVDLSKRLFIESDLLPHELVCLFSNLNFKLHGRLSLWESQNIKVKSIL